MVDLFTGTGDFSYAFESTGLVDVVFANDMVPQSQTIYNSNFFNFNIILSTIKLILPVPP